MDSSIKQKKAKLGFLRFLKYKILHIDDSPHKISLGFAIGIFAAWTPVLGIRSLMVIVLSIILQANKVAGLVSVWISNVFTYILFCYAGYFVGRTAFNIFAPDRTMSRQQVAECFNNLFTPANITANFFTQAYWSRLWALTRTIGIELWVGSFILGILTALGSYIICYNIIKIHRTTSPHRRYKKE